MYQLTPKRTESVPDGSEIYQIPIKYSNTLNSKALQNAPKIGMFDMKKYHLAALIASL
jgi:hypothetical protein